MFERYVNFEFYKTPTTTITSYDDVWEICKFWILQNLVLLSRVILGVWEICKFWILQNSKKDFSYYSEFERYVNFEFYKIVGWKDIYIVSLRDM